MLKSLKKPLLISIEGNIGAGKSTILSNIKSQRPTYNFIKEPLDVWKSLQNFDPTTQTNKNLLQLYYEDPHRWAYTFQHASLLSRFNAIESSIRHAHINSKIHTSSNVFKIYDYTPNGLDFSIPSLDSA